MFADILYSISHVRSEDILKTPLIIVCSTALALRLVFVFFPERVRPFSDMKEYQDKACLLLNTGEYGPATRPPMYPIFLAGIYAVSGVNFHLVRLVQALMGTMVCLFVYLMAFHLAGRRGALIGGLLVALYPSLIIYTGLVMSENLFIFLFTAALWMLICIKRRRTTVCLAAGVIIGVACLTRSVLAGFIPVAAFWLWRKGERAGGVAFLAAALLAIAPWTLRNYHYYHRLIPIDTFGGHNLLVGNNPWARGNVDLRVNKKLNDRYWRNCRDDAERAAVGYRKGLEYVLDHPVRFAVLGVRKIGYLYGLEIRDLSWAYSRNYFGVVPRPILIPAAILILVSFPLLAVMALRGMLVPAGGASGRPGAWALLLCALLYLTAVHFAVFGESRFHLPLVPIMAIYAARLALPGDMLSPKKAVPRALIAALVAILLAANWISGLQRNRERLHSTLGRGGNLSDVGY